MDQKPEVDIPKVHQDLLLADVLSDQGKTLSLTKTLQVPHTDHLIAV